MAVFWQAATQTVPLGNSDHEILLYVQEHYSTITLEKLAAHLHYTVPYCSVQISVKADRRTRIRILSHSEEARCVCLAAGGRIQKSPAVKV